MPDPAYDSLVLANRIELLGAGEPGAASLDPAFPGAIFKLQPGFDFGAPQPLTDFLGSLSLDGELPSGRRAGNRTFTLPVNIHAPDFATAAAATEALLAAVNEPYWTLTWTRKQGTDPAQLPLVFDCYRAHASVVQGGGLDGWNINSVSAVTLSFDASPYGRSATPVPVSLASPLPGGPSPASPVILDTFSSVSSPDFTQSSKHVLDSFSAKWAHSGGSTYPTYTKSFTAVSLAGLYNITAYVGFGAATLSSWQNPILFTFRLGDSHGKFLSFTLTKNCYPSNDPANPAFTLIHAKIPLGVATFDYANVTSYRIQAQNAPSGLFTPANFGFDTYYNHVVANPQSIQIPAVRGYVYQLPGVQGTARAPISVAAQLPGAALTEIIDTPGPFQWTAPPGLTGGVADVTQIAPGGAGKSMTLAGQGGGGEGGEVARETALALTAGTTYFGSNGIPGTPQTSISTLAITNTGLPSGTIGSAYNGYAGAFLKLIDFNFLTGDNTGFEATAGTWTGATNSNTARSTAQARAGTGSLAVTSIAAGNMDAAHCTAGNILTQGLTCASGDSINCRAYFRSAVSARNCQVGATFYTSGGVLISTLMVAGGATDSTTGWTFVQGQVTAPATTARARLVVRVNSTGAANEVHYVDDAMLGPSSLAQAITQWEALTGRALNVRREYFAAGQYGTGSFLITTDLSADAAAGRKVCLTLRPPYNPTSSTDRTNMATFLDSCKAAGLDADITLWHEPFYSGLTAAQFQAMIAFYGPTVRSRYPLVFCTANSAVKNNSENSYYTAGAFDKVATDYYAQGFASGDTLDAAAAIADSAGLPFGVWELNASTDAGSGQTVTQATDYFAYLQSFFDARDVAGKPSAELLLFNADTLAAQETPITDPADYRLPLWNSLYDARSAALLAALGGTAPYTFSVSSGPLPTGLALSAASGSITGVPAAAAVTTTVVFLVTDALGGTASKSLQIRIVSAATLAITTTSLPAATKGAAYSKQLAATGGTTPYTWSVGSGSGAPPSGMTLSSGGLVSGTSSVTGAFTFDAHVADSAAHTDDQVLTLTVGTVVTTGGILFGANSGNNYLNGTNGTHSGNWETVRSHLATTTALQGKAFGYRDYGPNRMPTSWNDGINVPAAADFSVLSWKPNIDNTLAGMYDTAITQWGISSQKKWNASPGSIFQSLWHEGDSLNPGSGGNPTSQQILRLHAYVFPRFVAACKSVGTPNGRVPYGQMFIGLTTKNSPSSWVSCRATVSGGSDLDWYGLDIYSHGGDPTADTMFTQSANNILAIIFFTGTAATECNSYNADAITYFSRLFTLCQQKNALFYLPFFNGCNNGDTICFSTTDSTRPGENAALRTILGQCAAAGAVTISKDPPAADATNAFFTGDSVTISAGGGKSATSITGASGNANISTNTVHHAGGAGASGGSGGGSTPGTPHAVCAAFSAASGSTLTPSVPVTTAVAAGEAILAVTASNSGVVSGVTDSKGNKYLNVAHLGPVGAFYLDYWLADTAADGVSPTVALTTSDSLHPVWTAAGATQEMITQAVSGIAAGTALDLTKSGSGTSASMSTGASNALSQASNWAITAFVNGNGGGSPTGLPAGGYALIATAHAGSGQYLTVAQQVTAATTAVTGTATIVSSAWLAAEIVIPFAATGATFGGGGGSSAGQGAAGAGGSGSTGGTAPDIGGGGGTGSLAPDTLPQNGQAPGGAGGGAASTGAAIQGGYGAPGRTIITRSTSIEKFSSLLLHLPGPDAPDAFSPLVQLGTPGVTGDGATEYPVPPLVTGGPNADFDGTYTIVGAATTLQAPQQQRTVIITVRQYEYPGGPYRDVPPDASSGNYTVIIDDDNRADVWSDIMFIDTAGTLICIDDDIPGAYSEFFIDEPPPVRDLGRILGTSSTRAAAISVLDKCLAVSGGPLSVYPGDNQILAWSRQGAPQLSVSYIPRWFASRTS